MYHVVVHLFHTSEMCIFIIVRSFDLRAMLYSVDTTYILYCFTVQECGVKKTDGEDRFL